MQLWVNVQLAFKAIRGNLLRTVLTFMIIAIGIMALVGILTAIDSIKSSIVTNFSEMGANSFTIRTGGLQARRSSNSADWKVYKPIDYDEVAAFKKRYSFPAEVSISTNATSMATVKHEYEKTNPNVTVMGVDENYLKVSGYSLETGRNFSPHELETGANVAILGKAVTDRVFSPRDTVLNQFVTVGNIKYRVVGAMWEKGASMVSSDNVLLVPIKNAQAVYRQMSNRYVASISVEHPEQLNMAVEEAQGVFRVIRGLRPSEADDFDISRSDRLANTVIDELQYVTLAATLIGLITLIGAGVGLMNIMLVSVAERTREIGVSKALGANNNMIRTQFLVEAVVICQIGGLVGIVLGILVGNSVSFMLDGSFIIPWLWILSGFAFCLAIGLLAGLYPALKAARLDPIEALRHE